MRAICVGPHPYSLHQSTVLPSRMLLHRGEVGVDFRTAPGFPPTERTLMKRILFLLLLVPVLSWAQSPFDGTWKIDMSKSKLPKKPDVYVLQNGTYECKSC